MNILRHIRFHGPNRPQTGEALIAPDIVITTYATLASNHDSRGLLYRMEWYRVVLDEGEFRGLFALVHLRSDSTSSSYTEFHFEAVESGRGSSDSTALVPIGYANPEQIGGSCLPCGISPTSSTEFQGLLRETRLEAFVRTEHELKAT